jgi:predicted RNase H-like nuclease
MSSPAAVVADPGTDGDGVTDGLPWREVAQPLPHDGRSPGEPASVAVAGRGRQAKPIEPTAADVDSQRAWRLRSGRQAKPIEPTAADVDSQRASRLRSGRQAKPVPQDRRPRHEPASLAVAGVDGVPSGWVVARVSSGRVSWSVVGSAAAVLAETVGCAAVGVDIPLGLPPGAAPRACDVACARRLGRARSSVFPAPPREVLAAPTPEAARAVARRLTGRAISLQAFHIGPKIRDWDGIARSELVVEVHPEVSLRTLAPDIDFAPKKTARGAGQRIAALSRWMDPATALGDLPAGARLDDVLDALAAAWSAARWASGTAEVLGAEVDDRGRPMRVVV